MLWNYTHLALLRMVCEVEFVNGETTAQFHHKGTHILLFTKRSQVAPVQLMLTRRR